MIEDLDKRNTVEQVEQLDVSETIPSSPWNLTWKLGIQLAAFSALYALSSKGLAGFSKIVARGAKRIVPAFGMKRWNIGFNRAYKAAQAYATKTSAAGEVAEAGIGGLLRQTSIFKNAAQWFGSQPKVMAASAARSQYYKGLGLRGKNFASAMRGEWHAKDFDMRIRALKGYFKADGQFTNRFLASAGRWATSYAKAIPGFYIADQALGIFQKDEAIKRPSPKWYNIPGHLAGMIKFGLGFAPVDIALRRIGPAYKLLRGGGERVAQRIVRKIPGAEKAFSSLYSKLEVGVDYLSAMGRVVQKRKEMGWNIWSGLSALKSKNVPYLKKKALQPYNIWSALKDAQKEFLSIRAQKAVGGRSYMKRELDNILYNVDRQYGKGLNTFKNNEIISAIDEQILSKFRIKPKDTWIQRMLFPHWKQRKLSPFKYIDTFAKTQGWGTDKIDTAKKLIGRKSLYYGSHVFTQGDFSLFKGAVIAEKALRWVGQKSIPIIKWKPFEHLMLAGIKIPGVGQIPGVDGAFKIYDSNMEMVFRGIGINKGLPIDMNLKGGEQFLKIGKKAFKVAPESGTPIKERYIGYFKHITAAERAHLLGAVDRFTMQGQPGETPWKKLWNWFELGKSSNNVFKRLKHYITEDLNVNSPYALMHERGKFTKLLHKETLAREDIDIIQKGSRQILSNLHAGEANAFQIFEKNAGLRNKILDRIGATEAARVLNENKLDYMMEDLWTMTESLPNKYDPTRLKNIRKTLDDIRSKTGSEREFFLKLRGSVAGQSMDTTLEEWIRGQYFRKTLQNYTVEAGKPKLLEELLPTIDSEIGSRKVRAQAKSLFVGMSFEQDALPLLNPRGTTRNPLADIDMAEQLRNGIKSRYDALKEIFTPHVEGLSDILRSRTQIIREARIPLESVGLRVPQNEMFIIEQKLGATGFGSKGSFLDKIAPGIQTDVGNWARRFLKLPEVSQGIPEYNYLPLASAIDRFAISPLNKTLSYIGLDVSYNTNAEFIKKFLAKRALLIPAAIYGYKALDAFVTANPLFDHTIFDEGLTAGGAEILAKTNIARAHIFDTFGLTAAAKYMEGLMPGSVESPAAKIARAAVPIWLGKALGGSRGALVGTAASIFGGFGITDLTRSAQELKDLYAGKEQVPVRAGRFWEFSAGPFSGARITSFQPSWYTKIKSQYRYTDTALGSKLESLLYRGLPGAIIDPYHYEKIRYWDRPTPTTAPIFHNVPIMGPFLSKTVGQLFKPQVLMHGDELAAAQGGMDTEMQGRGIVGIGGMHPPIYQTSPGYFVPRNIMKQTSLPNVVGESLYRATEAAGLRGFFTQSILKQEGAFQMAPTYDDASSITSVGREFWDLQVGGALGISEAWRRLYPRERFRNLVNPLRNLMPTWMPEDFKIGDPYKKIPNGLVLLPGRARERMYKVKYDFPMALEYFGFEPQETAGRMLKIIKPQIEEVYHTNSMKELVQRQMALDNSLIAKDIPIFDPYNKIEGKVDAITSGPAGTELMQIKTTTSEKLAELAYPKSADVSQLNFALRQFKRGYGKIMYVAANNPQLTKTFNITYSAERFRNDMVRMNEARIMAINMLANGVGQTGEAYSYPDRLEVLANAAPWSDEYKATLAICKRLDKMGQVDDDGRNKMAKAQRQRNSIMRKYDLYPYRFRGKVMTPDSTYNLMSENQNIKAAAEYSVFERAAGSVWERFSHIQIPFFHGKFMPYYTPEELYNKVVGGTFSGQWNRPISNFVKPWTYSFLSAESPTEGAMKLGTFGGFLGGPVGAAAGAGLGGIYGLMRRTAGQPFISKEVKKQRKINEYFDALNYIKGTRLYEETGDVEYLKMARNTVYGLSNQSSPGEFYRSVPYNERSFLWAFVAEKDPNIQKKLLKRVSPTLGKILQYTWNGEKRFDAPGVDEMIEGFTAPPRGWMGWRPDMPIEDIKLKTAEWQGLDAHDFGLGWYPQMQRMSNSPYNIHPIDISSPRGEATDGLEMDTSDVRNSINTILTQYGIQGANVSVAKLPGKGVTLTVNIS